MTHSPPTLQAAFHFQQLLPALLSASFASIAFWRKPVGHLPQRAYFAAVPRPSVSGHAALLVGVDSTGVCTGKKSP